MPAEPEVWPVHHYGYRDVATVRDVDHAERALRSDVGCTDRLITAQADRTRECVGDAVAGLRSDNKFDNVQGRFADAQRDAWQVNRDQHKIHYETTRDLYAFERRTDENFRAAERTAYENTARLADRMASSELNLVCALKDLRGELRFDVERVRGEVREAELRTGERICRDGDRTRDKMECWEKEELRSRLDVLETTDRVYRDLHQRRGWRVDDDCDGWGGRGGRRGGFDRGCDDDDDRDRRGRREIQNVFVSNRADARADRWERRDDFDRHDRHDRRECRRDDHDVVI